jgi:hypothetical protein
LTRHELLDYFSYNSKVTIDDIVDTFQCSYAWAYRAIRFTVFYNQVRFTGKRIKTRISKYTKKTFEITDYGLEKLKYYDDYGCNIDSCSCKK